MDSFSFYGNSLIDYSDKISCVVFYNKCNFRCPFCHNVDLLDGILEGFSEKQIIVKIEERKSFVDAVVVSGGEPTVYANIITFLRQIKNIGLKVKLDTNGYRHDILYKIIAEKLVDYIAMDIKTSLGRYNLACGVGVDVSNIIRSMEAIKRSEIDHEFRTTCVPLLVDKEDVESIKSLVGNSTYRLQNFSSDKVLDPVFSSVVPYSEEKMIEMRTCL
jgi:pyruvate formate lyase activating enzyme